MLRSVARSVPRSTARSIRAEIKPDDRQFPLSDESFAALFPSIADHVTILDIWGFQELASPIVGRVSGKNLVENQALLYRRSGDPEPIFGPRKAVELDTSDVNEWAGPSDTAFGNVAVGGSLSLLVRFKSPDNGTTVVGVAGKGSSATATGWGLRFLSGGTLRARATDGTNTANATTVSAYDDGAYHDAAFVLDSAADLLHVLTESEDVSAALPAGLITTINASGLAPTASLRFGAHTNQVALAGTQFSYAVLMTGVLTAADLATFRSRI